jgi:hypothetical protein
MIGHIGVPARRANPPTVMPAMQNLHEFGKKPIKSTVEGGGAAACRGRERDFQTEIRAPCRNLEQSLNVS